MAPSVAAHDTAQVFSSLWDEYLVTLLVVGFLVVVAIVFVAIRFRRRDEVWPEGKDSAPKLELAYLTVVTLIVLGLLTLTLSAETRVDALTARPALRIDVTGFQWQWRFVYPNGAEQVGTNVMSRHPHFPTLVVPAGEVVQFNLRSSDVLHEFFIPAMRYKRYAFANYVNRFDLTFPHPGRMSGACAQFCGLDHSEMRFWVLVLPPARFRAWLNAHAHETLT
jgi:cytochrome c oxidase subunit 2